MRPLPPTSAGRAAKTIVDHLAARHPKLHANRKADKHGATADLTARLRLLEETVAPLVALVIQLVDPTAVDLAAVSKATKDGTATPWPAPPAPPLPPKPPKDDDDD